MSRDELKKLSTKQLKALCKEKGLTGYSRLKEDELIDLLLKSEETPSEEVDELLDGSEDESDEDESDEDESDEDESDEDESDEDESDEDESSLVIYKKLIKGPFGFGGRTFKGSTIELTAEEAKHPKIKRAIDCKMIRKK